MTILKYSPKTFFKTSKILLFLSISISLLSCSNDGKNEIERWKSQAENIEIIRDDFGVPHIYGKSDADAVFGLLYAQCEDDFNRVERNYIWATGRLAEVEGEKAIYSDLRANLFMTEEEAIEKYNESPEWLKELCNAFADGINFYLYSNPEVKPKLLTRFEPWMPMYFSEGSIGGDIERISTKKIAEFYSDTPELESKKEHASLIRLKDDEPRGSNGFAISGKLTESGNAMLLINPHTSFFFRGEVHVVSEEGLNAYGAVTWGQFFVYQGFNSKNGWMHTSTYTDVMDEFEENVFTKDSTYFYKYGEEERKLESKSLSLKYKTENGLEEKEFTIYRSHHGPITHSNGSKWVATAMMWDPIKALEQSYIRTKLSTHDEFRKMMDIKTNSSNNTVYADADGNIAYYHGNFIPKRNVKYDYSKPVDGSNPDTDWKGLHDVEECIKLLNPQNGWIQNCNSTPFTSAAQFSPKVEDYPYYMSKNVETLRGIHAIKLLEKADSLNIDKLINLAYSQVVPAFEIATPGIVKAAKESKIKDKELVEAITLLENWDYTSSIKSIQTSILHFYMQNILKNTAYPNSMTFLEKVRYCSNQTTFEFRLNNLSSTLNQLEADFGNWRTPWGEINRYQRLDSKIKQDFNDDKISIPIGFTSGSWGALASFGARSYNTKRIYGTAGNSFVAVVEFGEKVKAKSMLAGGQASNPSSKHFDDQAQRYADVEFKDVAYYREDVEKKAQEKYKPGKRL